VKKSQATLSGLLFTLSFLTLSCGTETKESRQNASAPSPARENGMTFVAESDLPPCTSEREGFLVYVQETSNFRSCIAGSWTAIDLKGNKGDKGDTGPSATETNGALNLYNKYKHSIFRVELTCDIQSNAPSSCSGKSPSALYRGTAFLCGDKSVCSNNHVVSCPTCYEFKNLALQSVSGSSDTVNPDGQIGGSVAPFFTSSTNTMIKLHSSKDLARFTISQNPVNAVPLPISNKLAKEIITPLMPILSISFPLGFQDLYVDIGNVNSPKLGHCEPGAPENGGYGCPAQHYAFSTTNDTDHGSSGSPLIDLLTGEVVGLTTAGTSGENANYTWATDASYLNGIE